MPFLVNKSRLKPALIFLRKILDLIVENKQIVCKRMPKGKEKA
jgi:hypothetical protein